MEKVDAATAKLEQLEAKAESSIVSSCKVSYCEIYFQQPFSFWKYYYGFTLVALSFENLFSCLTGYSSDYSSRRWTGGIHRR